MEVEDPQAGEVTRLGGVKNTLLYLPSSNPANSGYTFSRLLNGRYISHVKKKNAGKLLVLAINALLNSLAALAATFSAVAFLLLPFIMMQSHRQSEFDVSRIRPRQGGLPRLETFTWQNLTQAERVIRSGRPG